MDEEYRPVASRSRARSEAHYRADEREVVITDVDIPFGRIVVFMVTWVLASIPALLILLVTGFAVGILLSTVLFVLGIWR
jgi:hypothetical protein